MDKSIKEKIVQYLEDELSLKVKEIRGAIEAARESRDGETKSSVGDKYETGRAMVQMELEKNQAQLAKTEALLNTLQKIDCQKTHTKIEFGSLAVTDSGNYFFSIAFGEMKLDGLTLVCLSPVSPIGKAMQGHTADEKVMFQNRKIKIREII